MVTCTTIGYGDFAPQTGAGRLVVVLYSAVGIPFTAVVASKYGQLFLDGVSVSTPWANSCRDAFLLSLA